VDGDVEVSVVRYSAIAMEGIPGLVFRECDVLGTEGRIITVLVGVGADFGRCESTVVDRNFINKTLNFGPLRIKGSPKI